MHFSKFPSIDCYGKVKQTKLNLNEIVSFAFCCVVFPGLHQSCNETNNHVGLSISILHIIIIIIVCPVQQRKNITIRRSKSKIVIFYHKQTYFLFNFVFLLSRHSQYWISPIFLLFTFQRALFSRLAQQSKRKYLLKKNENKHFLNHFVFAIAQ